MQHLRTLSQRLRPYKVTLLVMFVFVAGFALGNQHSFSLAQSDIAQPAGSEQAFEPFWQVYNLIENSYLDRGTVPTTKLVDGAINGMIESLDDQFSGYMDATTYPLMNSDLSGEVNGIGAVVETLEDTKEIRIVQVLEGSPAEKAGLKSGDIFVKVDDNDVTELSQIELVTKVRGEEGTTVKLTMKRDDEMIDFNVTRAKIQIPTVEFKKLENNIGYVKLRDFSVNAFDQLQDSLKQMDVDHLDGVVLDLRGNPGGLLSSAIDIASTFIKDGTILVEDFGDGNKQEYKANGKYLGDFPLVVLVDENSASASELVAGALQDTGRAKLVGVTTFGKGTVQTWQSLVNGGGIRLTIARWLTPNGNWIHQHGITPDIVVEWPDENRDKDNDPQLNAALNLLVPQTTTTQVGTQQPNNP